MININDLNEGKEKLMFFLSGAAIGAFAVMLLSPSTRKKLEKTVIDAADKLISDPTGIKETLSRRGSKISDIVKSVTERNYEKYKNLEAVEEVPAYRTEHFLSE